jgi:hypothetical protein
MFGFLAKHGYGSKPWHPGKRDLQSRPYMGYIPYCFVISGSFDIFQNYIKIIISNIP